MFVELPTRARALLPALSCVYTHNITRSELGAWFGTTGKWETAILPTFTAAVAHMKEHKGAEVVGVTGFCWGGMIAMKAASMGAEVEGGVKAAANVHPAMITPELAEDVSSLICYLASGEGRRGLERMREREQGRERAKESSLCVAGSGHQSDILHVHIASSYVLFPRL